jgi:hypothetical protein
VRVTEAALSSRLQAIGQSAKYDGRSGETESAEAVVYLESIVDSVIERIGTRNQIIAIHPVLRLI